MSVLSITAIGAVCYREGFVVDSDATRVRVHYIGYSPTHDEWVARDSGRLSLHLPSTVSHRRRQRRPEPRSNPAAWRYSGW